MSTIELYEYYKKSNGISIDSRTTNEGDLFFALKGPNFDGHKYIESAFEKGASYAIIDDVSYEERDNVLLVSNTEQALQSLARYHRCMITIPVLGITGSNGKTTTKELIASVLRTKYSVFATKGNLNNHLGVPISVLSIKDFHEIAIIEMGANHLEEIKFLSEIAMPDLGLITNIGKAHLEGFGDLEGVRKGKTELYEYLERTKGTIFFNVDDEMLVKSLPTSTTNMSYTISEVHSVLNFPFVGFQYSNVFIQSNLSGAYNIVNMVAALAVGLYFKLSIDELKKGIENYEPKNNRSQVKETGHNILIMDAYNANPSSMVESIKNFSLHPQENKTLILGHMLELGESTKAEHRHLINYISSFEWTNVFLVGSEFSGIDISQPYEIFLDTNELSKKLQAINLKDNVVLLKGSRGIALEKCIEHL